MNQSFSGVAWLCGFLGKAEIIPKFSNLTAAFNSP